VALYPRVAGDRHESANFYSGNTERQLCGRWKSGQSRHPFGYWEEAEDHLAELRTIVLAAKIQGGAVHDARIAAICVEHGVNELWTLDRDFSRFPGLRATNPLV
jgi:predicted nucleic acid-binding protein